ncbi:MAG: hypothetical protein Kapaf2KO_13340 [Candidatus Kapaibacteriales bacterium]
MRYNKPNTESTSDKVFADTSSIKQYELDKYLDDEYVTRPVKSIFVKRYDLINKEGNSIIDSNSINTDNYYYNKKGQLIKSSYSFNERFTGSYKYIYDDNGNRLTEVGYDENGIKSFSYISEYDENDNLISWKSITRNGVVKTEQRWIYNANNQLIEEINYPIKHDGFRIKYKYDSNGNKIKETYYDFDYNVTNVYKYFYNDKNQWIASKSYNEKDSLIHKEDYEYDKDGKLILNPFHGIIGKEINHRSSRTEGIVSDRYYSTIYSNHVFDEKGRLAELITPKITVINVDNYTICNNKVQRIVFKCDEYDNWIEINKKCGNKILNKTVRTIIYND